LRYQELTKSKWGHYPGNEARKSQNLFFYHTTFSKAKKLLATLKLLKIRACLKNSKIVSQKEEKG
jgi:hypothetical protein